MPPYTTNQVPAEAATPSNDSVTRPGEWFDPDRRPDEFAKTIRDQIIHDGMELDPRFHSRSRDHSKKYRIIGKKRCYNPNNLAPREQLDAVCTIHCFKDDEGWLWSSQALKDC